MSVTEVGALLHGQRYRIRQQLGRGGMGAVYLADDTRLPGRQVALKENLEANRESQQQFKREALLLARLHHPGLPQVTDYFADAEGRRFLVMDYIPGVNLRELMKQRAGPLSTEEVLAIADQVMQALAYMHTWRDPESGKIRPIIHRDVKPDNIKRTPDGRVMLVDFGIAKVGATTATLVSARALTPGYAPIEQYDGGTDERSDVYALGATLYALLTGKTPPRSIDLATGAVLPALRSGNNETSVRLAKVIERAMKLNARDRFPSIEQMYIVLFGMPMPTTPITTSPPRGKMRKQWSILLPIGLGVAGLIVVILFGWILIGRTGDEQSIATNIPIATVQAATVQASVSSASPTAIMHVAQAAEPIVPSPSSTATTEAVNTEAVNTEAVNTAQAESSSGGDIASAILSSTVIVAPTATRTPEPTRTPVQTSTPLATRTLKTTPTSSSTNSSSTTPRPTTPTRTNPADAAGPQSAIILEPANNHSANSPTTFRWRSDAPLAPGQEYEVVFWRAHEGNEAAARGLVRSSAATEIIAPVQLLTKDTYRWAVYLVRPEPYTRLRRLSGPYLITIAGDGNDSNSGG